MKDLYVNLGNYSSSNNSLSKPFILKLLLWYPVNVLLFKNPFFISYSIKRYVLRLFGSRIGKNVVIKPCVSIKAPWFLIVGDNSWIGENVWIDNLCYVTIGKNVCISQGATLVTGNHDYTLSTFDLKIGSITIEDGAWLCANTTVCDSVTISSHAILLTGSTATSNLDEFTIYQGCPAIKRKLRKLVG